MSSELIESPGHSSGPLAEISQGPDKFNAFLDRNQKGIIALAIAAALAGAGYVIWEGIETSKQESAGAALTKASDLASYQAVIDGNPGTIAASSASLLLANSQWDGGKKDEAVATLQKFISSEASHPAIASAKANLGSKLMALGKTADATKIFEDLASDPAARFIAPFALISLGDIAKASGDLTKAETSYKQVSAKFMDSAFVTEATKRLASLKTKPPVEIEPPPAPPAPPAGAAIPGMPTIPTPGMPEMTLPGMPTEAPAKP
jgi:predicted negative regulator of RcsB-dependent stress response